MKNKELMKLWNSIPDMEENVKEFKNDLEYVKAHSKLIDKLIEEKKWALFNQIKSALECGVYGYKLETVSKCVQRYAAELENIGLNEAEFKRLAKLKNSNKIFFQYNKERCL